MSGTTLALMCVAVVGSRTYPGAHQRVYARLKSLRDDFPNHVIHIISGGARGVDSAAAGAAHRLGLELTVFAPDWDGHGTRAGRVRTDLIVDAADRVIAFWDFKSRGTAYTIRKSIESGKYTEVWNADGEPAGPAAAEAVRGR